jgi:hypothetical protein
MFSVQNVFVSTIATFLSYFASILQEKETESSEMIFIEGMSVKTTVHELFSIKH